MLTVEAVWTVVAAAGWMFANLLAAIGANKLLVVLSEHVLFFCLDIFVVQKCE